MHPAFCAVEEIADGDAIFGVSVEASNLELEDGAVGVFVNGNLGIGCLLGGIEGVITTGGFYFGWVLVFVHSPSRDVELVGALISDVAVAIIPVPVPVVMEAVVVEWSFRGGAEPDVVMDACHVVGIEADTFFSPDEVFVFFAGAEAVGAFSEGVPCFVAEAFCHVDFSEFSIVQELHSATDVVHGAVLEADGDEAVVFSCGFDHFSSFEDVVRAWLFDVDVLSGLACPDCGECVPVVGDSDCDGVDVLVVVDAAEVVLGRRGEILDLLESIDSLGEEIFIDVAKSLDTYVRNLREAREQFLTSASNSDDGHIDSLVCTEGVDFSGRCRCRCGA